MMFSNTGPDQRHDSECASTENDPVVAVYNLTDEIHLHCLMVDQKDRDEAGSNMEPEEARIEYMAAED